MSASSEITANTLSLVLLGVMSSEAGQVPKETGRHCLTHSLARSNLRLACQRRACSCRCSPSPSSLSCAPASVAATARSASSSGIPVRSASLRACLKRTRSTISETVCPWLIGVILPLHGSTEALYRTLHRASIGLRTEVVGHTVATHIQFRVLEVVGTGGDYLLDLLVGWWDGRVFLFEVIANQDVKGFFVVCFQVPTAVAEHRAHKHKLLLSLSPKHLVTTAP